MALIYALAGQPTVFSGYLFFHKLLCYFIYYEKFTLFTSMIYILNLGIWTLMGGVISMGFRDRLGQ